MLDLINVRSVVCGHTGVTLFESSVPNEVLCWFADADSYRSVYSVYDVHPKYRVLFHTRCTRGELWVVPHGLD